MKVEIKNEEKKFNPIKINIEIETLDELKELWCRLNIRDSDVKEFNNIVKSKDVVYDGSGHTYNLFDLIDDKLIDILKD